MSYAQKYTTKDLTAPGRFILAVRVTKSLKLAVKELGINASQVFRDSLAKQVLQEGKFKAVKRVKKLKKGY